MGQIFSKKEKRFQPNVRFDAYLDTELVKYKYPFKNLVLAGGGVKAVSMAGALKVLEIVGILGQIKGYCGSSAGSIVALALALGYSADEIVQMLLKQDFASFKDSTGLLGDSARFTTEYGLYSGENIYEFIGGLVKTKLDNEAATFGDLFAKTGKHLVVTACNLNKSETIYFSHTMTPATELRFAVRASISIPFLFVPVQHGIDNDLLVDGSVLDNYALDVFCGPRATAAEQMETLGIRFVNTQQKESLGPERTQINTLLEFSTAVITRAMDEIERLHVTENYWERTIPIYTGSVASTDFDLSIATKKQLFDAGVLAADKFLNAWVIKHAPRRLSWAAKLRQGRRHNGFNRDAVVAAEHAVQLLQQLRTRVKAGTDPMKVHACRSPRSVAAVFGLDLPLPPQQQQQPGSPKSSDAAVSP